MKCENGHEVVCVECEEDKLFARGVLPLSLWGLNCVDCLLPKRELGMTMQIKNHIICFPCLKKRNDRGEFHGVHFVETQ